MQVRFAVRAARTKARRDADSFLRGGGDRAVDLTDDNYETVLATGTTDNPFAPTLPEDDVWVITVFGPDPSVHFRLDEVSAFPSVEPN